MQRAGQGQHNVIASAQSSSRSAQTERTTAGSGRVEVEMR